ncbi:MAG: hypothetical protein VX278_13330 [Myxococcota bacterium]|nr:hypothetical protein [Myxococcota bacterium]
MRQSRVGTQMKKDSILGIIPCSKEKIWDTEPHRKTVLAKEAYRSAFHRYARCYAQRHCAQHIILSAKYGFMKPDFPIQEPYDISFSRPKDPVISVDTLQQQAADYRSFSAILVLCPKAYAEKIAQAFYHLPPKLLFPLQNIGGFGSMHRFLKDGAAT